MPPVSTYPLPAISAVEPDPVAHVTVKVPVDAQVWFADTPTTSKGPLRQFNSPPLTPGSQYTYDVRASWNENGQAVTQTQHVEVSAGAHVNVSFPISSVTTKQQAGGG
jgi:uncharacterized protein (TIGR03000 family)